MKLGFKSKIIIGVLVLILGFSLVSFYNYQNKALTVLAYHSVMREAKEKNAPYSISENVFVEQMEYLQSAGYHVVTIDDAIKGLQGEKELPTKPLLLTFDDGYKDNFYIMWPILQRYNYPATVFVATSLIATEGFMTWKDIKAAHDDGIDFASHTINHKALANLTDDEIRFELAQSKRLFKDNLDIEIEYLAYPFGSYNQAMFPILQETGYKAAFTGNLGTSSEKTQVYELERVNIVQETGKYQFRLKLLAAQVIGWLKYIVKF